MVNFKCLKIEIKNETKIFWKLQISILRKAKSQNVFHSELWKKIKYDFIKIQFSE